MTLTLTKELCGFDLLPNGEVSTCSATGLSTELKWADAAASLRVSLGNLEARGGPGSCRDRLLFKIGSRPSSDPSVFIVSARSKKKMLINLPQITSGWWGINTYLSDVPTSS